MSVRSPRALGALAAVALSCISVIGLQATAASAAEAATVSSVAVQQLSPREYDPSSPRPPAWEEDATKPVPGNDHSMSIAGDVQLATGSERPVVEHPAVRAETAGSERPVVDYPPIGKPIWCTDVVTGEVFQCGWQGSPGISGVDASVSDTSVAYDFWDGDRPYGR